MFRNIHAKFTIGLLFFLIIILVLSGCDALRSSASNERTTETENNTQLLSVSCFEKNADISFYKLDTVSKQAELLKTQATQGAFMPNVLSDDGNLYYPKRDSSGRYVQLFKYNLESNKEIQLTSKEKNNTTLIEYVQIDNLASKIFMRIFRPSHQKSELAAYNFKTEEMIVLGDMDNDTEVLNFDLCKKRS